MPRMTDDLLYQKLLGQLARNPNTREMPEGTITTPQGQMIYVDPEGNPVTNMTAANSMHNQFNAKAPPEGARGFRAADDPRSFFSSVFGGPPAIKKFIDVLSGDELYPSEHK